MGYEAPFAGLKVVDLSQGIAGPYCAMLLAQQGAQVIKVEGPGDGDWSRVLGRRYGDHSAFSIIGNLGKRAVSIDLKLEEGKALLWKLIAGADVFIEGFRPGVIQRLGFDYKAVSAREPRIVYLSISGFGQHGPLASRPAMDPVLQAFTGLTRENHGEDGIPHRVPVIPIDMTTSLYAFAAVSSALYGRRDQTRGRFIDASLMQGAAGLQAIRMMSAHLEGGVVRPGGVPGGSFKTLDGWMSVAVIQDRDWLALCKALDAADLGADPRFTRREGRFEHEAFLQSSVRTLFGTRTNEWLATRMTEAGLMFERVNDYAAFLKEPHVVETDAVAWLTQPDVPAPVPIAQLPGVERFVDGTPRSTAPRVGQDTAAVLAEHGCTAEQIEDWARRGVIDLGAG